jgi:DNA repair protein RecN (Recombination protein N)
VLHELAIENYAVIENLRVRFHAGLNLLTGETGSGKSIVVDALALLLGGRASPDMVRTGAERARIAGIFDVPEAARAALDEAEVEWEDGELLVVREILANGKSRAYIGSRPVTAALLKRIAATLGDIHGQHDQQQLFDAGSQLDTLDQFAAAADLAAEVAAAFAAWRECERQIAELDAREQEKLRLADLWTFQKNEIEAAAPRADEDRELDAERRLLQNVVRIEENARQAFQILYEAPASAAVQLRQARKKLDEIVRFDGSLSQMLESLRPAEAAVEDAAFQLRSYLGKLEADPLRLDAIETRLAALDKLKRKYGPAIEQALAYLDEVRANLAALEQSGERRAELEASRQGLADEYRTAAAKLSARRKDAARKLEKRLAAELRQLAMERAVFRVELAPSEPSARGAESARFLISPNVGEEPRPLERIASGGELSRVALALKSCALEAGHARAAESPRTLVFDEVDAGIGGATAETVGRRLKRIAGAHQVLCVTHLAQIAGFADHHYHVAKTEARGRTVASIRELDAEERKREIGRMLSGQRLTPEALRHAEQLMKLSGVQ